MSSDYGTEGLRPFFSPREIVVIGASRNPARLGHVLARNACRFAGPVHLVNPSGGTLFGRPLHASVADVPGGPDLAVLLVPSDVAADALAACAARGIKHAVLASGGFSESGPEGAAHENAVRDVVARTGMRLIGPNCVGVIDTAAGVDTTFLAGDPAPGGGVAFVSQSGALCASVIEWAAGRGFGLSRLVSVGNMLDVAVADVLNSLVDDDHTRVVLLYLEGLPDGRCFVEAAARVAARRPVVALKAGRSAAGRLAAASHTGAMAGEDAAWEAAFVRAGITRATGLQGLIDAAVAFERCPLPRGRRVAILTNAGGPGVVAADHAVSAGLRVPVLPEPIQRSLAAGLPGAAGVANPVDLLASASPDDYRCALQLLASSDAVDAIVVLLPTPPSFPAVDVATAISDVADATRCPVLPVLLGSAGVTAAATLLRDRGLPVFDVPEQAINALKLLTDRAAFEGTLAQEAPGSTAQASAPTDTMLSPVDAAQLAAEHGIPVAGLRTAFSADEAALAATSIGYPVAIKISATGVSHKSDVGGVALSLPDASAVSAAYASMQEVPGFCGVLVQAMAPDGLDLVVGAIRDPQFGPLVAVGSGGTEVESLADVAYVLAPCSTEEARTALLRTAVGGRFAAHRNRPAFDMEAAVRVVVAVGQILPAYPSVQEFEINPLRVFEQGQGVRALDIRSALTPISAAETGTKK